MAHIEFTANGVLMIAVGLPAREMRLGAIALKIWFATLLVGTWMNGAAGLVGAFAGQSSRLMPTLNQAFPAPGGLDNPLVTGLADGLRNHHRHRARVDARRVARGLGESSALRREP